MKAYILVRTDILNPSQIAVQSGHALAELMLHPEAQEWARNEKTLIILATSQGYKLESYFKALQRDSKSFFTEPDLDGQITAIAWLGEDKLNKKFQLYKG